MLNRPLRQSLILLLQQHKTEKYLYSTFLQITSGKLGFITYYTSNRKGILKVLSSKERKELLQKKSSKTKNLVLKSFKQTFETCHMLILRVIIHQREMFKIKVENIIFGGRGALAQMDNIFPAAFLIQFLLTCEINI